MQLKLDTINILVIVIALINMVYGLIVYSRNRRDQTNFTFFILTLSVSSWGIAMFLYRSFTDPALDVLMSRLLYVAAATIPISFLYFVFTFPEQKKAFSAWQKYLLPLPFLLVVFISIWPGLLIDSVKIFTSQENYIQFNIGYHTVYALYIIGYFSWAYLLVFNKIRRSSGILRVQLIYILAGTLIATMIGVVTNLILPYFEIFTLNWVGQIGTVAMISLISYSILKYRLFNIRLITTELFVFTLWVFIFVRAVTAQTVQDQISEAILLALTIIVGIFLIRSVLREVEQREKIELQEKELEAANEQQQNFIHFLSHEVKGILGKNKAMFAFLLEDTSSGPGGRPALPQNLKPLVLQSLTDTDQSVDMVVNILRSADLKTGNVKFEMKPFDFETAVLEAVANLKPDAEHKGLKFDLAIEPGMPYSIVGDKENLTAHVIRNLIDNSIRYTPSGSVSVRLAHNVQGEKSILFSVADTGVGISEEDKMKLFTEGGHGKDSQKVNVHSTGYGLFFAKGIVEAHKGRIWAESEGAGKGATFFVELPVRQP